MTRVNPVEPGTRPELAEIERAILAQRGRVSILYQVLLNSGPLAAGWEQLLTAIRNRSSVAPDLRELMILRVAVLNDARYEFDAHVPHARQAGVDDSRIEALRGIPAGAFAAPDGTLAPEVQRDVQRYDERARLVLELTDAMTREIEVPDALMQRVKAAFDDRGVVETVATVAAYNMVSRFLRALHIGH